MVATDKCQLYSLPWVTTSDSHDSFLFNFLGSALLWHRIIIDVFCNVNVALLLFIYHFIFILSEIIEKINIQRKSDQIKTNFIKSSTNKVASLF